MTMTTTVTIAGERGVLNPDAYAALVGYAIHVPGLDPAYVHLLRSYEVWPDGGGVTLTVDTERGPRTDLARHLSVLHGPKARVQAVDDETGDVLAEGRYDAPLQEGQLVYVNGAPHAVVATAWPNRTAHGRPPEGVDDFQVARLSPQPADEVSETGPVFDATAPDA